MILIILLNFIALLPEKFCLNYIKKLFKYLNFLVNSRILPCRYVFLFHWGQASSSIRPKSEMPNGIRRETSFWTFLQTALGTSDIRSTTTSWPRKTCWTLRPSNSLKWAGCPRLHLNGRFELTKCLRSNCRRQLDCSDKSISFQEPFGLREPGRAIDLTSPRRWSKNWNIPKLF